MFLIKELCRSLRRHSRKTGIALAVSLALAFFLFLFSGSIETNRLHIKKLEEDADLKLTFVNSAGTRDSGIIIYDDKLQEIEESGLAVPDFYAVMALFSDGSEDDTHDFTGPYSPWGAQPLAAYSNDSSLTAAGEDNVTYFDGYDGSLFSGNEQVCLLEEEKFQRMGLSPGDELSVTLFTFKETKGTKGVFKGQDASYKVVGTFQNPGAAFSGVSIHLICPYRTLREQFASMNLSVWPSKASLSIPSPQNLNALKALLQEIGILPVNKDLYSFSNYGKTAVINDGIYISTAEPTLRTLSLLQSLYPVALAAVVLIALLASYLLTQSRREEIAVSLSLGAGRFHVFLAFFLESALLCLVGAFAAFLVCVLALGQSPVSLLLPGLSYLAAYLVGSSAAILLLERTNVLAVLAASE